MAPPLIAHQLRADIASCGGLADRAGLARRWGISYSRVRELSHRPDFPAPIVESSGCRVYLVVEVDEFRDKVRRAGRPPKNTPPLLGARREGVGTPWPSSLCFGVPSARHAGPATKDVSCQTVIASALIRRRPTPDRRAVERVRQKNQG